MADVVVTDLKYSVVTQYPTVEFLGGTKTQDVIAVGIITDGSGIYVEFRIPANLYSTQQVKNYATGYTGTVESVAGIAGVVGAVWSQQPNAANELVDYLTLTVTSDSGNSQANLLVPESQWAASLVQPKVTKLIGQLNASEALTS